MNIIITDKSGENAYSIYHDLIIDADPGKVFQYITRPEHLVNWWPYTCEGIPKENETYNFFFGSGYDWYGKVIKLEEQKSFHIKMVESDPDWDPTTFGFDLKEHDDKVHLQFWHRGWPECNTHFRRSSFCWAPLLTGLKNYIEKGLIIPFEERA